MVSVRGDFRELADIAAKLSELGEVQTRREITLRLAEECRTQILLGFEQSRDPYGKAWPAPVLRPGGKPLLDTGRLRNSLSVRATDYGFTVQTGVRYAATHQYGAVIHAKQAGHPLKFRTGRGAKAGWRSKYTVRIPRRQFMPEGELGPIWTAALSAEADRILEERFGTR